MKEEGGIRLLNNLHQIRPTRLRIILRLKRQMEILETNRGQISLFTGLHVYYMLFKNLSIRREIEQGLVKT